jgi:hypothetical protein
MGSPKNSDRVKYVALALLALSLGSRFAAAQDYEGKFNLPFAARWGETMLTPGRYSFTYQTATWGGNTVITLYRGTRGVAMILTGPVTERHFSGASHLTAVRRGETYRITSLQLTDEGIKVDFPLPRNEVLEATRTDPRSQDLPILLAAK